MGGKIDKCDHREYGFAEVKMNKIGGEGNVDALFEGLGDEMQVASDSDPVDHEQNSPLVS
jgi:GMP synthase (glutamine-hydrolysing)